MAKVTIRQKVADLSGEIKEELSQAARDGESMKSMSS